MEMSRTRSLPSPPEYACQIVETLGPAPSLKSLHNFADALGVKIPVDNVGVQNPLQPPQLIARSAVAVSTHAAELSCNVDLENQSGVLASKVQDAARTEETGTPRRIFAIFEVALVCQLSGVIGLYSSSSLQSLPAQALGSYLGLGLFGLGTSTAFYGMYLDYEWKTSP